MNQQNALYRQYHFHRLKVKKIQELTKTSFAVAFEIPKEISNNFEFLAGQYVGIRFEHQGEMVVNDYSITSAPHEHKIEIAVRFHSENGSSASFSNICKVGAELEVSEPKGRFTLVSKPHEFRTIVAFAAGIGITPILSHIKHLLHTEPRTRIFLFYGNKSLEETVFRAELDDLALNSGGRFQTHYFVSQDQPVNSLLHGRIDRHKVKLIINQILNYDDTDEESTIWDAVDEVLICGSGPFIKEIANASYEHGIPKKNIHFELFEEFNEDIYPVEVQFPLIKDVSLNYTFNNEVFSVVLEDNSSKILQSLLEKQMPVPFSCKSGICGSCICTLKEGEVELLENEYLTESEQQSGKILACMSFALDKKIVLDFDQ